MQMKYGMIFTGFLVVLAGCGQESVETTYEVPKSSKPVAPKMVVEDPAPVSTSSTLGFTTTLPKGWTQKEGTGMRMVSYTLDGTSVDFYLISLRMGDVPSNVNRWRGQVGLPSVSPEEITKEVSSFQVDGHAVNYIEIYNDEGGNGIIAAIVDLAPQYWYFTAKGSVKELKANAVEIRAFLESLKFEL
jgi:hypothetical protein